jgi:hypothetical protein
MELAIINGTYRDGSKIQQKMNQILIPGNAAAAANLAQAVTNSNLRSPPNPLGQPLIISPRLAAAANNSQMLNGAGPQHHQLFASSTDPSGGLIYTTIPTIYSDHHVQALNAQTLLEYPNGIEFSQAGKLEPHSNLRNWTVFSNQRIKLKVQ